MIEQLHPTFRERIIAHDLVRVVRSVCDVPAVMLKPWQLFGVIQKESGFDPLAIPPINPKTGRPMTTARGLLQMTQAAWEQVNNPRFGGSLGLSRSLCQEPFEGMLSGALYLQWCAHRVLPAEQIHKLYKGDCDLMFPVYVCFHDGPGNFANPSASVLRIGKEVQSFCAFWREAWPEVDRLTE